MNCFKFNFRLKEEWKTKTLASEHYEDTLGKLYHAVGKKTLAPTSVMLTWMDPDVLTQPNYADLISVYAEQNSSLRARSQVLFKIGRANELLKEVKNVEDRLRTREVRKNAFLFIYYTAVCTYISRILLQYFRINFTHTEAEINTYYYSVLYIFSIE